MFSCSFVLFRAIPLRPSPPYYHSMYSPLSKHPEDLKKRRMIARSCVRTHFVEPWQFRIEVDGMKDLAPKLAETDGPVTVFDYLVKGVGFGPTEFETEPVQAGAAIFTYPKSSQPVVVTMTVRDTADRLLYNWFNVWAGKVLYSADDKVWDGTFNLPASYVKQLTIHALHDDTNASVLWSGHVYPQKMGDIEHSVDGEGFLEFPVVFQQFATLGSHT